MQTHHFACEWALSSLCDFDKLKTLLETFDIYGYSAAMKDTPITSVDDIRNLMNLCHTHHDCALTGVHNLSFPVFLIQKLAKDGMNPVNKTN